MGRRDVKWDMLFVVGDLEGGKAESYCNGLRKKKVQVSCTTKKAVVWSIFALQSVFSLSLVNEKRISVQGK